MNQLGGVNGFLGLLPSEWGSVHELVEVKGFLGLLLGDWGSAERG